MDKPSMFEQSRSLIAGAKIIIDSDGINDNGVRRKPSTPVILSCAFAIEVSLKLLLLQETEDAGHGHNLEDLFNKLPEELLNRIVDQFIAQNPDENRDSLNTNLSNHKKIFVNWRYAFENTNPQECSPSFLYSLAYSLNTFIEENYDFERNGNGWLSV